MNIPAKSLIWELSDHFTLCLNPSFFLNKDNYVAARGKFQTMHKKQTKQGHNES